MVLVVCLVDAFVHDAGSQFAEVFNNYLVESVLDHELFAASDLLGRSGEFWSGCTFFQKLLIQPEHESPIETSAVSTEYPVLGIPLFQFLVVSSQ